MAEEGTITSLNQILTKLINNPAIITGNNNLKILIPLDLKAKISRSFPNLPNTVIVANSVDIGIDKAIICGSFNKINKLTSVNGILYLTASPTSLNNTVLPNKIVVNAKIPLENGTKSSLNM